MKSNRRNQSGFSLLEALIASVVTSVAILAMFSSWSTCFKQSKQVTQLTQAEEIARSVIEIAKVYGPANLPVGVYSSTSGLGTWSGAYLTSTGWTTGATAYYNFSGTPVASSSATGAYFTATTTLTDASVLQGSGTTYTIQNTTLRSAVVTVSLLSGGTTVYTLATNIIIGGM